MKLTKDQKIKSLERIVKAVFAIQEGEIGYKHNFEDIIEVTVECDVDDAVKQLSNLGIAGIDYWFYTGERKIDPKYSKFRNCSWEGYTEITLTLETEYWKKVEKLQKENKALNQMLKKIPKVTE